MHLTAALRTDAPVSPSIMANDPVPRRRFLLAATTVTLVGLAGCTGDDDDAGDDPTPDDGTTPGGDGTPTPGGDDTPTPTETTPLGDRMTWTDSFIAEATFDDPETGESMTITWEVDGENSRWTMTEPDSMEFYQVDGTEYWVTDGQCFQNPTDVPSHSPFEPDEPDDELDEHADLEPAGSGEIEGEPVDMYELEDGTRFFVEVDSGYLRRVTVDDFVLNYHSWGEAGPIEAPDMECQEFQSP